MDFDANKTSNKWSVNTSPPPNEMGIVRRLCSGCSSQVARLGLRNSYSSFFNKSVSVDPPIASCSSSFLTHGIHVFQCPVILTYSPSFCLISTLLLNYYYRHQMPSGIGFCDSQDAIGIVAKLSDCIASRGGNILAADVFVPQNKRVFYSRTYVYSHLFFICNMQCN